MQLVFVNNMSNFDKFYDGVSFARQYIISLVKRMKRAILIISDNSLNKLLPKINAYRFASCDAYC